MKKLLLPIILFMMFIPFYVNAETCDTDKISISSIIVEDKSDNVEEIDEANASGKNINLNLSMSEVGDNIKYKFVVKNDSNEDYELDKNSFNISSEYIDYTLESDDKSNIVKANSSKIVYLKIEYKNEVSEELFEAGTYNDNKTIAINLSTGETISAPDTLKNPNTGVQYYIIILLILLIISSTILIVLKKKQYIKFMILIFGTGIMIPIGVYALCKCEISVDSNVTLKKEIHEFCYAGTWACAVTPERNGLVYYDYIPGETFEDYYERTGLKMEIDTFWGKEYSDKYIGNTYHVSSGNAWNLIKDKTIQGKDEGCYSTCPD